LLIETTDLDLWSRLPPPFAQSNLFSIPPHTAMTESSCTFAPFAVTLAVFKMIKTLRWGPERWWKARRTLPCRRETAHLLEPHAAEGELICPGDVNPTSDAPTDPRLIQSCGSE